MIVIVDPRPEYGIDQKSAVDVDSNIRTSIRPEAGGSDVNIVAADGQAREGVCSRATDRDGLADAPVQVGDGYGGFGNHRTARVLNGTRNGTSHRRVSQCWKAKQQGEEQEREEES